MRVRWRETALVATLSSGSALGYAQAPVTLRLRPPLGQVSHYRVATRVYQQGGPGAMGDSTQPMARGETYLTTTVDSLRGDTHVITTLIDSARAHTLMGDMPDPYHGLRFSLRRDARGHVLSADSIEGPYHSLPGRSSFSLGRQAEVWLPAEAVQPGSSWSDSQPTNLETVRSDTAVAMTRVSYRLERLETEAGAQVAVVTLTGSLDPVMTAQMFRVGVSCRPMMVTGQARLEVATGRVMRMTTEGRTECTTSEGDMLGKSQTEITLLP